MTLLAMFCVTVTVQLVSADDRPPKVQRTEATNPAAKPTAKSKSSAAEDEDIEVDLAGSDEPSQAEKTDGKADKQAKPAAKRKSPTPAPAARPGTVKAGTATGLCAWCSTQP